ncbi:MAG: FG-GAP repeat domain-containing protein, partial [Planctomycetota bacterium]
MALAILQVELPQKGAPGPAEPFIESLVEVAGEGAGLLLRDLTGDGALDLLRADGEGLSLTPLAGDARFGAGPAAEFAWPTGPLGWEVADLDGDGVHELLTLEPRGVVVRSLDDAGAFAEGRVVLPERAVLPAGVQRVHFVRDVDRDGRADVVLPAAGLHRIFLAREDGWAAPIEVAYELSSEVQAGDRDQLGGTFGQRVRVPWFRIEDVDGDGLPDLVSETEGRIAFHLAQPELSSEPTWILDLAALKEELPQRGSIDFDNLFSFLDERVTWQVADVDGQAPNDLLVVLGSKLRVYLGGSRKGPQGAPDQVLKSSGNVLLTFLRDTGRGALPDLQILRAERISIARVIRSLILPGKLDFDVYTYHNEDGTFGKRPARRNRVTIELPRLIEFMEEEGGIADELEAQFDLPTRRLPRALSEPAAGDDVVDVLAE